MIARLTKAVSGPIARRLLAVLLPLVLLPLIVSAATRMWQAGAEGPERLSQRSAVESRAFASAIGARLAAAEASAWTFSRSVYIAERGYWRQQVVSSAPFRDVSVSTQPGADARDRPLPPAISRNKDDTSIATFGDGGRAISLYLVRSLRDTRSLWGYFELDRDWLWQDLSEAGNRVAVIDSNGQWLFGSDSLPDNLRSVLGAAVLANTRDWNAASLKESDNRLSWQAGGHEWRGTYWRVPNLARLSNAASWNVVVMAETQSSWMDSLNALSDYWLPFLLAIAAAGLLAAWFSDRYLLPLADLQKSILQIGNTDYVANNSTMPVELGQLAENVRLTGLSVADQISALQALEEVDRLLLANGALEPALDAILARVQRVMRARAVGLALLDTDSAQFARVMVAADTGGSLPVARVTMDAAMLEYLASVHEGITVARCEEQRHSFLRPLQDLGNQYFWVWPVRTSEKLTALLAIGFQEPPAPDPRYAKRGTEFAARLSIALSNSARDESLYRQAHFDPLTGLPNRVLFNERLAGELESALASGRSGSLLYVDLDHFKKVNDTVGHAAGDQLLGIIAQRLRAAVKEGDLVARLAGDEFTIILPTVDKPESAALVAERIIESLHQPVNLGGRDQFVAASIGIAMFPNDGSTVEDLLRNADGAMYRAKAMGRGRAVFFDRKLAISQSDPTQSGLFRALRRREFALFYQPQFDMADGRLVGLEALLRWHTPRDGMREPKEFVPAAEASGLIVDIGGWVLEAACAQFAAWREQGIAPPRVSINVSAQQLKYAEFPRSVRRVLDKFAIAPELLELELTETVLAEDAAGAALLQIAALGVRIALDDFGTGYSSLNYLRLHPIHAVKIDRSFLEEVPVNPASATLAESIITMAHALGKEVVAEGVETAEQMQFLREHGCDIAQGFFLARPMPVAQITELLQIRLGAVDPGTARAAG